MLSRVHRVRSFEYVLRDPQPEVLVVTNMWPDEEHPVYGVFVERQVQALREAGIRCDVLYIRGYLSKLVYVTSALRLLWLNISARNRYRLAHIHAGETALVARFFAMHPMIATYHGDDMLGHRDEKGAIPPLGEMRAAIVRRHAALFTATITQSGEMHRRLGPRVRKHNTIIRCGVDTAQFSPTDRDEARAQLGWSNTERIVLFAATRPRDALKRLDLAQASVAEAEAEIGPIRLIVAENLSPDLMPAMMSASDCLLLTSMSEGSPMVVKEAMLCTLPVVATDVGDVRELLAEVSPSSVCRHDPQELGSALADVLRTGCRSNGREQAAALDQSTTVRHLLHLYSLFGVGPGVSSTSQLAHSLV